MANLKEIIKQSVLSKIDKRMCMILARTTPNVGLSFTVELAEHCNLNCAGCDHFSPLTEPKLVDVGELTRDFKRLAELFGGRIFRVGLMGGEPLLHPELIDILRMSRQVFPTASVEIWTNGIKLLNEPEEFWLACRENHISLKPTRYPISFDYDAAGALARKYGVDYSYTDSRARVKTLFVRPLDREGRHNPNQTFLMCDAANRCITLKAGRLYTCTIAPNIHKFNKYFGIGIDELPEDSIDIYQAASAEEILEFLARPIPFCRYCATERKQVGIRWHQSKKKLEEWMP